MRRQWREKAETIAGATWQAQGWGSDQVELWEGRTVRAGPGPRPVQEQQQNGPPTQPALIPKGETWGQRGKCLSQQSVTEMGRGPRCHGPDRTWGPIYSDKLSP